MGMDAQLSCTASGHAWPLTSAWLCDDRRGVCAGMCAMAAPVLRRKEPIGVISIAGPKSRLTPARMLELAPALLDAAAQLGSISNASNLFGRPPLGNG
jgi:hypothetical protein